MVTICATADEAVADIPDGATLLAGGFGLCGIPEHLIAALVRRGTKDLTVISNNCGVDDFGLGLLLRTRQIRKMVSTYVGENKTFEQQFLGGSLEVELVPQGTFAERLRAGGAGIPAFYTPTGVGTQIADGGLPMLYGPGGSVLKASPRKETREFGGRPYVLEQALRGDFALVKAWRADESGNLVYRKTARNFNPMIATCGKVCVAEVEELVEAGSLDPDHVHTPGIYVDRIIQGVNYEKRIEFRTVAGAGAKKDTPERQLMAKRAAQELRDGYYVNLGIGIPTLVANYIPAGISVTLQSENGLLGIGPFPYEDEVGQEGVGLYRYVRNGKRWFLEGMPRRDPGLFDPDTSITIFTTIPPAYRPPRYPSPAK